MPFLKQTILFNIPRDCRALARVKSKAVRTLAGFIFFFFFFSPKNNAKSRQEKPHNAYIYCQGERTFPFITESSQILRLTGLEWNISILLNIFIFQNRVASPKPTLISTSWHIPNHVWESPTCSNPRIFWEQL